MHCVSCTQYNLPFATQQMDWTRLDICSVEELDTELGSTKFWIKLAQIPTHAQTLTQLRPLGKIHFSTSLLCIKWQCSNRYGTGQKLAMGSRCEVTRQATSNPQKVACIPSNSDVGRAASGAEGSAQAKWIWEQNKVLSSSWKVLRTSGRVDNSLHRTVLSPALQSIFERVFLHAGAHLIW